jgi:hypothetical protein
MRTLTKALIVICGSIGLAGCVIDDSDYVATSSSTTYYRPAPATYQTTRVKTYYNAPAPAPQQSTTVIVKEKHRHSAPSQPAAIGYQMPAQAAPAPSQPAAIGYQQPAQPQPGEAVITGRGPSSGDDNNGTPAAMGYSN